MARYSDAVCKLCRREEQKLFLKGERCLGPKCAIERRNYPPGDHGKKATFRRKVSDYGRQLREKQKARRVYGVMEKQFRRYFREATRRKGLTGVTLLVILESRLDNVVYRMGFADSRAQARQLVRHGHFNVNGRKTNIPSYNVSPGDVIAVRDNQPQQAVLQGPSADYREQPGAGVVAPGPGGDERFDGGRTEPRGHRDPSQRAVDRRVL